MVGVEWLSRDSFLPESRLFPLKVLLHPGVVHDVHRLTAVSAGALELPDISHRHIFDR